MQSAFAGELARVNDTKLYKAANKMAKKITQASKKAWLKLRKMVGKHSDGDEETKKRSAVKFSDRDFKDGKKSHREDSKHRKTHKKSPRDDIDDGRYSEKSDRDSKAKKSKRGREKKEKPAEKEKPRRESGYRDLVARHLSPIYDRWQSVYRDVRGKVGKKSLRNVWDSLLESDKEEGDGEWVVECR